MSPELVVLFIRILLAVLLYLFLGAVLLTGLREIRQAARTGAEQAQSYGKVIVVDPGPTSSLEPGAAFPLRGVNTFGRAPTNSICVQDDTASTAHARLTREGEHWLLEDLGSRNGTSVNGALIDSPTVVTGEDVFQIGRVVFRLDLDTGAGRL